MENLNRKDFIRKACLASACLCGLGSMGISAGHRSEKQTAQGESGSAGEASQVKQDVRQAWLAVLLTNISMELDENEKRKILKSCAAAHYEELGMDKVLTPFRNDLEKFIRFLEQEWDWIVSHEGASNVIIADENKSHCVCPMISNLPTADLSSLCYCSEGFAERMFSYVVGVPVTATLISSIHRGNEKCIYKIEL